MKNRLFMPRTWLSTCVMGLTFMLANCSAEVPAFKENADAYNIDADKANPNGSNGNTGETSTNGSVRVGTEPNPILNDVFPDDGANDSTNGGDNPSNNPGGGNNGDGGSNPGGNTGDDDGGNYPPGWELPPGIYQPYEMNLTQTGPKPLDVLFVVDNSGSMSEEQSFLSQNFSNFINQLHNKVEDFQVAVTNTDICLNPDPVGNLAERVCPGENGSSRSLRGSFVGTTGRKVLKSSDSDLITKFSQYALVGTNGSGFEHGLKAAQLAISKSLSGANEPLVRDGAYLSVIVVSDEEDDGWALTRLIDSYTGKNFGALGLTTFSFTDQDFISYAQSVKGNQFSVSTITGTRNPNGSMCSASHSQPTEEGTQYIRAANATGGIVQSICSPNWDTLLASMGDDLNSQITQIQLDGVPDFRTIHVYVNGEETTEWEYIYATHSVKFNTGHVPEAGDEIRISYLKKI